MNKVIHFEIPADDIAKATKFYGNVFGWEFKAWSDEYSLAITAKSDEDHNSLEPGAINGGIQKRSHRAKTPTFVIQVDSIDNTLKNIETLGGKVAIPKESIADMGFYAQFDDPEGNRIGLFQEKK
jgi:predicted enzyme related to lactoylglutathione lyase